MRRRVLAVVFALCLSGCPEFTENLRPAPEDEKHEEAPTPRPSKAAAPFRARPAA